MALHANEELLVRAQPSRGQKPFPLRQTNSPSSQSRLHVQPHPEPVGLGLRWPELTCPIPSRVHARRRSQMMCEDIGLPSETLPGNLGTHDNDRTSETSGQVQRQLLRLHERLHKVPPPADRLLHVGHTYHPSMASQRVSATVPPNARTWAGPGSRPAPMPPPAATMPGGRPFGQKAHSEAYIDGQPAYSFPSQPFDEQASFRVHVPRGASDAPPNTLKEPPLSQSRSKRRLEEHYEEEWAQDPLVDELVRVVTKECIVHTAYPPRKWAVITNDKQRKRIEQRREWKMKLMVRRVERGYVPQLHHPSRQDHASRRPRGPSGRFLGKDEPVPTSAAAPKPGSDSDSESVSSAPPPPPKAKAPSSQPPPQPPPRPIAKPPALKPPTIESHPTADLAMTLQREMHETAARFKFLQSQYQRLEQQNQQYRT